PVRLRKGHMHHYRGKGEEPSVAESGQRLLVCPLAVQEPPADLTDDRQVQYANVGIGTPVVGRREAISPQVIQNIVLGPAPQETWIDLEDVGPPEKARIFFANGC